MQHTLHQAEDKRLKVDKSFLLNILNTDINNKIDHCIPENYYLFFEDEVFESSIFFLFFQSGKKLLLTIG